jgi:FMN phosphatase YigB (HAD superfamily)
MFPRIAVEKRLGWAGLHPADFDLITTYENAFHSKPNPLYYADILRAIDCEAADCLMVGNDVDEDMAAGSIGIQVFLLTDYLINRQGKDIAAYPHGKLEDLIRYLHKVCGRAQTPPARTAITETPQTGKESEQI